MSVTCPDCGEGAGYGREIGHRSNCPSLQPQRVVTGRPDTRPPTVHELKTWESYFHALYNGQKWFEIRKDDRGFRVGDELYLRETRYGTGEYTGREMRRKIGYILRHEPDLGLMDGYCILSLQIP